MIKEAFRRTQKPLSELLLQTMSELGKHYSRLELAHTRLRQRNEALFDACSYYLQRGAKGKAAIYANEVAEIRKILTTVEGTQLSLERAMLRLETFKAMAPTLEDLKGVFGDVKNTLGILASMMPSITPELENLNSTISEVLETTQFSMEAPEPLIIQNEKTEAILQEAATYVGQELEKKIPEPPVETRVPTPEAPAKPIKPVKPLIALAADGTEVYVGEGGLIPEDIVSSASPLGSGMTIPEELVMDYIERNNGEINVAKCAQEFNMPGSEVYQILDSLSGKGKIRIEK